MITQPIPPLPAIVAQYLAAANRFDPAAAAACFTADARVHDEQQDHVGTDAITRWVADTSRQYRPQISVIHANAVDETVRLHVAVTGEFPGSPVELDYALRLQDGKIAQLNIQ